jgi:hypothetical protein
LRRISNRQSEKEDRTDEEEGRKEGKNVDRMTKVKKEWNASGRFPTSQDAVRIITLKAGPLVAFCVLCLV